MRSTLRGLMGAAALAALLPASDLLAQGPTRWVGGGVANDWTDGDNWSEFFQPDAEFDTVAILGSETGVVGVPDSIEVTLTTDLSSIPAPGITLGDGGGFEGTLNLNGSARLVTAIDEAATSADFNVGFNGGNGFLNVRDNAQLNVGGALASNFTSGGESTITLQDNATVTASSAVFERNLRVVGPSVSLAVAGDATFAQFGVHEWDFALSGGSAGPSAIQVGGELRLGGTLKVNTQGATPSVGDAFTIADSATVSGGFATVDTSEVPGIGLGVSFRTVTQASGASTNGLLTSVVVEQQPILVVNRQTGSVSLQNPGVAASVAYDTYAIGSGQGALEPANWSSLAPAAGWQQGNPSANSLSELNPTSSGSLAGGEVVSFGKVYQPAEAAFGDNTEDIAFRFAPLEQGFVNGVIVYEGIPTDTLTLNVDRNTGEAQIVNGFREPVAIDTYLISSESGSLNPSPAGWESLGGNWQIGVNDANRVSELNPLEALTLANSEAASLGSLFDSAGSGSLEDLVFQFVLPNENFFRTGKVVFGDALTDLTAGDYNLDGSVDAADYTVWRDGDSPYDGQEGYDIWAANFGATAAADSTAVPEPTAVGLLLLGATSLSSRRRR